MKIDFFTPFKNDAKIINNILIKTLNKEGRQEEESSESNRNLNKL